MKYLGRVLLILAIVSSNLVHAQVLVRNGKQIPLKPSTRYIALKLHSGIAPSDATFTAAVANREKSEILKQSPILAKHGIVVIKATAGVAPASPSGPHFTAAATSIGSPVPVYTWGDGDIVLTDEVIFKPKPEATDAVLKKLAGAGTISRANDYGTYILQAKDPGQALELSNSLASDAAHIEYRGGSGFSDTGISGFLSGHDRRGVHEETEA